MPLEGYRGHSATVAIPDSTGEALNVSMPSSFPEPIVVPPRDTFENFPFEVAGWQLCSFTDRTSAVFVDGTLSTHVDGMFMGHFKAKAEVPKHADITVENVNVDLLRTQRDYLLTRKPERPEFEGLISLLDYMLDKAEGFGDAL